MSQTKAQLIDNLVQALSFTGTSTAPANGLFLSASNQLKLSTNSAERLKIDGTEIVVNDIGSNVDFRVEGDADAHLLVADASTDKVAIGVNPSSQTFAGKFHVKLSADKHIVYSDTQGEVGNVPCIISINDSSILGDLGLRANHLNFAAGTGAQSAAQKMTIDDTGVAIGTGNIDAAAFLHIKCGTDKNIHYSGGIGEIGSVAGFQTVNDAANALVGFGIRASEMNFAIGSSTVLRLHTDGTIGIGESAPDAKLEVKSADSTYALKLTCSENVSGSYNGLSIAGADENSGSYPLVIVSNTTDTHETGGHPILCCNQRRVGIGTLTPSVPLNVVTTGTDAALFESTSGDANGVQLSLRATSASPADNDKLAVLDFSGRDDAGNNTTYAQIRSHSRDVSNGSEDGDITFHTRSNGSFDERVHIKSDGNVSILGGHLDFANGYGIDFGATSNSGGSMSSELLDDYEEGTWTPILTDDGTSGNSASSYTHQLGWYTKVGNIVNLQCRISGANTTGFNTPHSAFIKNLPFAIKGSSNRLVIGSLMLSNVNLDGDTMGIGILANVGAGSGSDNYHFRLFQTKDNAVWGDIEISQIPSGNHEIQVNFTYRAA